jgi:quinol-cytochrome oxidoreductase complex cytochrome b subunit
MSSVLPQGPRREGTGSSLQCKRRPVAWQNRFGNEGPFRLPFITTANDARFVLIGGTSVGDATLIRFYVLHCIAVPFIFCVFLCVHLWRVRKDSFSRQTGEKVDVWPHLVSREFLAALLVTIALFVWSLAMQAPLEEQANINVTPNPSKAPWYFVGLQELLVYFDPWIAGVALPTLIIVGLMALPYVDINPRGVGYYNMRDRKFAFWIFTYGLALWFVLIFIGYYMRGPGWEIYMPWEKWDHFRATSQVGLHNAPNWFGILFLFVYGAVGAALPKILFKNFYKQLGPVRYGVVIFFVLAMFFVPVKMILRNFFKIKYLVSFPDFNFNI